MKKSIRKLVVAGLVTIFAMVVMSCNPTVNVPAPVDNDCTGFLEGAGEVVSTGIKIGETTFEKTSEVTIVPDGKKAVINMEDDSSWNTYVTESAGPKLKGVFIKDRKVILSPFVMSQYEVTQELYEVVLKTDTSCNFTPSEFKDNPATNEIQKLRPVERVTWYDAVYFCNSLTKLTMTEADCVYTITDITRDSTNKSITSATVTHDLSKKGYRLPTEAEWEYAARGGNPQTEEWKNAFGKVNTKDSKMIYDGSTYLSYDDNLETVGWYSEISGNKTHEVGLKDKNSLNLYDMAGNVWEWCWDWFANDVGTGTFIDPCGAAPGDYRVYRGGSFNSSAFYCTGSTRFPNFSNYTNFYVGFRVCRSIQ